MGAFKAVLKIGDEQFDVRWFKFGVDRGTNNVGKVTTSTRGGGFACRVPSSTINILAETMVMCEHTPFDCSIDILEGSTTGVMKTIEFKNCSMTDYQELFDADSEMEASTYIAVTANIITIGSAELHSNWTNDDGGFRGKA